MVKIKERFIRDLKKNPIVASAVLTSVLFSILLILVLVAIHREHNNQNNINYLVHEDYKINEKIAKYLDSSIPASNNNINYICENLNDIKRVMIHVEGSIYNQFLDLVVEKRISISQEDINNDLRDHVLTIQELKPTDCKTVSRNAPKLFHK